VSREGEREARARAARADADRDPADRDRGRRRDRDRRDRDRRERHVDGGPAARRGTGCARRRRGGRSRRGRDREARESGRGPVGAREGSEGTEGAVDGAVPRFAAPMPSTTGPSALAIGLVAEPTPPACSGSEGLPGTRAVTPLADGPLRCRSASRGAVRSSVRPYSCGLRPLGAGFRRPAPSSPQHRFPLHLLVPPDPPKISVFSCWFRCR